MPELSPVQAVELRKGPQKRLMTHQDRALEPPRKLSKKLPKKDEAVLFESIQTPPPQEVIAEFTFPTPVVELWGEMPSDHDSTNRCEESPPVAQDMWCSTNNNLGLLFDVEDYTLGGCVAPAEAEGKGVEQKQEIEYMINDNDVVEQEQIVEYEYMVNNNGVLSPVDTIGGSTTSLEQEQESLETEKDVMVKLMQEAGIAITNFDDWDLTGLGQPTTVDFLDPEDPTCDFEADLLESIRPASRTSTQVYPAMLTTILTGVEEEEEAEDKNDPIYDPAADLLASMPSTSRTSTRVYAKKSLPAARRCRFVGGKRTKKPGRPQREEDYEITAVPSRREINDQGLTKDEVDGLKYRRQRDLNNLASQKCRAKRGVKVTQKEQELVNETERNVNLRKKADHMEKQMTILKGQMTSAQLMHVRVMMASYL